AAGPDPGQTARRPEASPPRRLYWPVRRRSPGVSAIANQWVGGNSGQTTSTGGAEALPGTATGSDRRMRLSTIKLSGFKSFVDPTTLHLPTNMTGVVGPNGCGKSNIID